MLDVRPHDPCDNMPKWRTDCCGFCDRSEQLQMTVWTVFRYLGLSFIIFMRVGLFPALCVLSQVTMCQTWGRRDKHGMCPTTRKETFFLNLLHSGQFPVVVVVQVGMLWSVVLSLVMECVCYKSILFSNESNIIKTNNRCDNIVTRSAYL